MDRRRFLKVTAVTGASAALASCGHPENQIIRFIPDDEFVPGVAVWKPSICPLCPAGCGLNVRVMDADVEIERNGERGVVRSLVAKKLEGLPTHPVNRGGLCARGQAAIQITYHPDRLRHPMKRSGPRGSGLFTPMSWDDALAELARQLDVLADAGRQRALAYVTKPHRTYRDELTTLFLERFGAPPPVRVSLLDEEVLRLANAMTYGRAQLPTVDLAHARFVLGLGADFLGTWNSPVAQSAAYGQMRQGTRGQRGTFVQVEARMSQTGANADEWVYARPGTEGALALGLAHVILRDKLARGNPQDTGRPPFESWSAGLPEFAPAAVEGITGVPADRIEDLARRFTSIGPAVAVIGGPALAQTNALAQALAVNALNTLVGNAGIPGGIQFTPQLPMTPSPATDSATRSISTMATEILGAGTSPVDLLIVDDANPVFASPKAWRVREAIERVPFIASFSTFLDETSIIADLILPDHSFLESWVDAIPESGTTVATASVAAPAMRPLYSTRSTPDVLLDVAKRLKEPLSPALAWPSYEELLRERFAAFPVAEGVTDGWAAAQERGGWWANQPPSPPGTSVPPMRDGGRREGRRSPGGTEVAQGDGGRWKGDGGRWNPPQFDGDLAAFPLHLLPYASTTFYDGSTAHLPWLQEMPDPMTTAMWSNWIEVNPRTAAQLQLANGDIVEITSQHGAVRAPAVITPGIAPDVVAMPIGQGHTAFTRYASGRGSNPIEILAPVAEPSTGRLAWAATRVRIARVGGGHGELKLFAGHALEHPHEHR